MTSTCDRLWMVEAMRDDRIVGDERVQAELHVASCAACSAEHRGLDRLAARLETVGTVAPSDAARLRVGVLARVDAELAGRSVRPQRARARFVASAIVAAALAAVIAFLVTRPGSPRDVSSVESLSGDARFVRTTASGVETIRVDDGSVRVRVQHQGEARRVLVLVPDGEIEDIGTVFEVDVVARHVQRVRVSEGAVILRLAGAPPVAVARGESWARTESATPSPAAVPSPEVPASSAPPPSPPQPSAKLAPPPARPDERAATPATSSTADDAAAEDAAYLHIVSLLRAGKKDEARAAASEYLRKYPNGFRREEVGAVAK